MHLIRGIHNLRPEHQDCVATIGNFDGIHLGHQAVIAQVVERAVAMQLPSVVIIFEPQPQEFFRPDASVPRLCRFREKILALQPYAIDRVLCLKFNQAFSSLSADEFIQRVLVKGLGIKHLVVGDDFKFGHQRSGDFDLLQKAGVEFGFEVANTQSFEVNKTRVSSTLIRQALSAGNLKQVETMLGRAYSMSGRIAHGDKRGRTIGFPTANIHLHRNTPPLTGVYAVQVLGLEQGTINGVANLGTRPTVGGMRTLLEVHLFDFNKDIYGAYVEVRFIEKLRDEQRFESFAALKEQIHRDADNAKCVFSKSRIE